VLISTTSLVLQLLCGVKNVNCGSVALMVPSVKTNKSTKVIDRAEDRKGLKCDDVLALNGDNLSAKYKINYYDKIYTAGSIDYRFIGIYKPSL
jgi:hypothetical protein